MVIREATQNIKKTQSHAMGPTYTKKMLEIDPEDLIRANRNYLKKLDSESEKRGYRKKHRSASTKKMKLSKSMNV